MRPYGEFTVRRRGHSRVLFEYPREIRHVVEAERVGNFSQRHIVFFDKPYRLVDFEFRDVVHDRLVIVLFENSANMRNAVIQVVGDLPKRRILSEMLFEIGKSVLSERVIGLFGVSLFPFYFFVFLQNEHHKTVDITS